MRKEILFIAIIALFASCSSNKKSEAISYEININKYIEQFCKRDNKEDIAALKKNKFVAFDQVVEFYKNRNFKSVWVAERGVSSVFPKALHFIRTSMSYGFDTTVYVPNIIDYAAQNISPKAFLFKANTNKIAVEMLTTHSLISLLNHINIGLLHPDTAIYGKPVKIAADSVPYFLEKAIQGSDFSIASLALAPKNPHYRDIQSALSQYLINATITKEKYPIPYFAKDSSKCKEGVEKMLIVHGYLNKNTNKETSDNKVIPALVKFQTDFGLNNRGRYDTITIETLRNSSFDFYRKACLTLQRIRWSAISDKNYVLVNIPSFTLNLVEDGEIAVLHRIVAGKPDHETPELNSRISHFNLFPEWNVPHKISTKELLPLIQADPKYLEKHNYEIINGKEEVVDASKLKWKKYSEKNFPYRIRQSSGEGNSLGIIKFYFPNEYGVYLHDTPSKKLFERNYRAFSHGCMRVQNPFVFAKILLEFKKGILHHPKEKLIKMGKYDQQLKFEKYRKDKEQLPEVKTMNQDIQEVKKTTFTMNRPLPIYVRYLTAFINEKNKLQFYPDLYHKDSVLVIAFDKALNATTLFK
jgi:murein L,D-transpeptidase YcbB/YkuD